MLLLFSLLLFSLLLLFVSCLLSIGFEVDEINSGFNGDDILLFIFTFVSFLLDFEFIALSFICFSFSLSFLLSIILVWK